MPSAAEEKTDITSGFSTAARNLVAKRMLDGRGRGEQTLVRMTPAVKTILEAAKEPKQSMAEFLREARSTVALLHLKAGDS